MFYKSLRDEVALTNIGPGSYNLAYTWRTDEHNYAHLRYVYYLLITTLHVHVCMFFLTSLTI